MIRIATLILNVIPLSVSAWLGRRAGDFIYVFLPLRRKIALENLDKAYGDTIPPSRKARIARGACRSMVLSMVELFTVGKIKTKVLEKFTLNGGHHLDTAFDKGKGVLLVISHLGSWEYLSFLPYITGKNWSVVVKQVRNPYLNEYIRHLRMLTTVVPIEKTKSIRPVLEQLHQNNGVAILIDQWAGPEGLWINFFDEKTSTTSIPARLAKKTGCALVPAYCIRAENGKYDIHIHPPVTFDGNDENWEKNMTENLSGLLEEMIKRFPEQWLWAHRRWKNKPDHIRNT